MRKAFNFILIRVGFVLLLLFTNIYASHPNSKSPRRVFDINDILEVKIFASISKICKDRWEDRIYHPAKISYKQGDGTEITKIMGSGNLFLRQLNYF